MFISYQEAQLWCAGLQGVSQDPESLRVAGELEDAEDAEDTQGHEGAGHLKIWNLLIINLHNMCENSSSCKW